MSNTETVTAIFFNQYRDIIANTIKNNKVNYTTENISGKTGHHYYIDSKEAHISTIKVVGSTRTERPKFMLNIEIKSNGKNDTCKCSGADAKRIHEELYQKYKEAINRTRLRCCFQNPSFARTQKVRG